MLSPFEVEDNEDIWHSEGVWHSLGQCGSAGVGCKPKQPDSKQVHEVSGVAQLTYCTYSCDFVLAVSMYS